MMDSQQEKEIIEITTTFTGKSLEVEMKQEQAKFTDKRTATKSSQVKSSQVKSNSIQD